MTKTAIAAVLASSLVAPSITQAADHDLYDKNGTKHSLDNILLNPSLFDAFLLDIGSYKYELGGKTYNAESVNNLYNAGATQATIAQKVKENGLQAEEIPSQELVVESVTAINSKQVEVKFTQAVKKDSVIAAGKLAASKVTVQRTEAATTPAGVITNTLTDLGNTSAAADATLSTDGKTLTITTHSNQVLDGTYTVQVSGVVAATTEKTMEAYASTFKVSDKTQPTVTDVKFDVASNKFEITYSEPIKTAPVVVRVNGEATTPATVSTSDQSKVTVARPAAVKLGSTVSLYVAGAQDGATNMSVPYTGDVTLSIDENALQVTSVEQKSSNEILVVFNKPLDSTSNSTLTTAGSGSGKTDSALTFLANGTVYESNTNFKVTKDLADTTGKTYILKFTAGTAPNYKIYSGTTANISLVFANNVLKDVYGQSLATDTKTLTLTKDTEGPKVVSAKIVNNKIEVTFDEDIASTGGNTGQIVLRKDGVALSTAASAIQKGSTGDDAKVLQITLNTTDLDNGKMKAGTYTVRLNPAAIKDAHSNDNTAQNATVSKDATAATEDLKATVAKNTANNKIKVTFTEAVTADTALNASNYTLDGAALPTGTDIYFADSTKTVVNIDLPANSVNIGSASSPAKAEFAVSGVQTAAGKTVVATSGLVDLEDNTPTILKSAKLLAANVLELTFDEDLDTKATLQDVDKILAALEINSDAGTFAKAAAPSGTAATASASISGKIIVVTVVPGDSNWNTVTSGSNLKVKTLGVDTIKDKNSVVAKANVSVGVTK